MSQHARVYSKEEAEQHSKQRGNNTAAGTTNKSKIDWLGPKGAHNAKHTQNYSIVGLFWRSRTFAPVKTALCIGPGRQQARCKPHEAHRKHTKPLVAAALGNGQGGRMRAAVACLPWCWLAAHPQRRDRVASADLEEGQTPGSHNRICIALPSLHGTPAAPGSRNCISSIDMSYLQLSCAMGCGNRASWHGAQTMPLWMRSRPHNQSRHLLQRALA